MKPVFWARALHFFFAMRTLRHKIARDLWSRKTRTVLVVLSIASGVFGVGTVINARAILNHDLGRRLAETSPAHAILRVQTGVDPDDLHGLRRVPNVTAVQGRGFFLTQVKPASGKWEMAEIIGIPDFREQHSAIILPQSGAWPPGRQEVLLERQSQPTLHVSPGDLISLKTVEDTVLRLRVAGLAHRSDELTSAITGVHALFVNMDTFANLAGRDRVDTVYIRTRDYGSVVRTASDARDRLERAGYKVDEMTIHDPARHPAQDAIDLLFLVMLILSTLCLILSSFLVTNTVEALVREQTRQIGVMKAIGASTGAIGRLYILTVLIYGIAGTALAIPLADLVSAVLNGYAADVINVDLLPHRPSALALIVMAAVGIVVPVLASLPPIWNATRVTVRQATGGYGLGAARGGAALRICEGLHGLPSTWMLALRNAFRNGGRLLLTTATLALGGIIFVAVLSTDASFGRTIIDMINTQYRFDAIIAFPIQQRISRVAPLAQQQPQVTRVEAWHFVKAVLETPAGNDIRVALRAVPLGSEFYEPRIEEGRWLAPGRADGIVVSRKWAIQERLQLGDTVKVKLGDGQDSFAWRIVGIVKDIVDEQRGVFVSAESLNAKLKQTDRTFSLLIRSQGHSPREQQEAADAVSATFERHGIQVMDATTISTMQGRAKYQYQVLVIFLLLMAGLIGIVGGLGLMGMTSINVMERYREVGVMRAIGANTSTLLHVFWREGLVISGLSFVITTVLAVPAARALTWVVGNAFVGSPLDFRFATAGLGYWLCILLAISTPASILPALRAANQSVRDSLAYE